MSAPEELAKTLTSWCEQRISQSDEAVPTGDVFACLLPMGYPVLRYFGAALIRCCVNSVLRYFGAALFRCCAISVLHYFGAALLRCCVTSVLHTSR
jgi:hypothetical protein